MNFVIASIHRETTTVSASGNPLGCGPEWFRAVNLFNYKNLHLIGINEKVFFNKKATRL